MRLIDTDKLKFPNIAIFDMKLHGVTVPMVRLIDLQMLMPTVDAAPVKHGRWEDYGHCSCCGWGWSDLVYDRTEQMSRMNYCPCCGACMDLEEQDAKEET